MRKLFSIIVFTLAVAATATAVPAYRGPIVRTMEDGSEKIVYLHGNEHFHYMTDSAGMWLDDKRLTPLTDAQKTARLEQMHHADARRAPQQQQSLGDEPYLVPRTLVLLVNFADTKFSTPKDTIDSLIKTETIDGNKNIPPAPKGKNIWGSVTINERGQLVIPKAARERFGLSGGQRLIVLSYDKEGIALVPAEIYEERIRKAMEWASSRPEE